jgi:hypothetical protein
MASALDIIGFTLAFGLLFAFPIFLATYYAYKAVDRFRHGPMEGELTPPEILPGGLPLSEVPPPPHEAPARSPLPQDETEIILERERRKAA